MNSVKKIELTSDDKILIDGVVAGRCVNYGETTESCLPSCNEDGSQTVNPKGEVAIEILFAPCVGSEVTHACRERA